LGIAAWDVVYFSIQCHMFDTFSDIVCRMRRNHYDLVGIPLRMTGQICLLQEPALAAEVERAVDRIQPILSCPLLPQKQQRPEPGPSGRPHLVGQPSLCKCKTHIYLYSLSVSRNNTLGSVSISCKIGPCHVRYETIIGMHGSHYGAWPWSHSMLLHVGLM
jgi:hypothetical protein